jgi:hypothetical protein
MTNDDDPALTSAWPVLVRIYGDLPSPWAMCDEHGKLFRCIDGEEPGPDLTVGQALTDADRRARVALLRELAAELLERRSGPLYEACIDRGTPSDVGHALAMMADVLDGTRDPVTWAALEAKVGRTASDIDAEYGHCRDCSMPASECTCGDEP